MDSGDVGYTSKKYIAEVEKKNMRLWHTRTWTVQHGPCNITVPAMHKNKIGQYKSKPPDSIFYGNAVLKKSKQERVLFWH